MYLTATADAMVLFTAHGKSYGLQVMPSVMPTICVYLFWFYYLLGRQ